MSAAPQSNPGIFRLRLPATSANLGSAFDAAAVAVDRYLDIEAESAAAFSIDASGYDAARCSRVDDNLILEVYERLLREHGRTVAPLALRMQNGIPLTMGLGSSAAARLAGIALANHFGSMGFASDRILEEACAQEGHPDNAVACWLGGFVMAAWEQSTVRVGRVVPPAAWRAIVVLPREPLSTSKARATLPASYPRADVVRNIQSAGLLGLAFAQGRGDLLRIAMSDRIHQPYRASICPLIDLLVPLAGREGILGVALSGAGPAVLAIVESESSLAPASAAIRAALTGSHPAELLICHFEAAGAGTGA
jgi:homoserine kinase